LKSGVHAGLATLPGNVASTASSTAPITTPTQQTMHVATQLIASADKREVPQSAQDPLLRSARMRVFRAFQHVSPLAEGPEDEDF
jgi:hypothetical protein